MFEITLDPAVALFLLITLGVAAGIWAYRLRSGVPFHPFGTVLFLVISVGFFLLVEGGSVSSPSSVPSIDLALVAGSALVAAAYAHQTTRILRFGDGAPGYRTPAGVPMAWLGLLLLAVYVQVLLLGQVTFFQAMVVRGFPSPVAPLAPTFPDSAAGVLALVDGLFALSTGIVVGQGLGVYTRLARVLRGRRPLGRRAGG